MTLAAGSRLGPYEVLAPLGAGGMGEVYRARDTRLERDVAVKVLPKHLSSSEEMRQRFEREAKAISQLSHPHICALYDVGSHEGTEYLVMELLEGETLAARLTKGALPLEQTFRFGGEIAEALDKAHRQGIVHRDLKPGNVMLTKSGVKLLDFGLAKVMAGPKPQSGLTSLPTMTGAPNLTQEGTILGTFQYMAPEQLEGKEADFRSDIFAFGALLYEMATGAKAFTGSSQASLISAILRDEPKSVSALQPMTPLALDRVVKTCLAKDPEERWQSAHDVGSELKWIAEGGSQAGSPVAPVARRRSRVTLAWAVAAMLLAALALALVSLARRPEAGQTTRFEITPPEKSQFGNSFALSPDGRRIAFVATSEGKDLLWIRALGALVAQPLTGTEDAQFPFWSPDSKTVAFFADSKLKRVEVGGGSVRTICPVADARGGSWGSGDVILFTPTIRTVIYRVSADGGTPAALTTLDTAASEYTHRWPQFLPDGRHFLFLALSSRKELNGIRLGSVEGGPPVKVLRTEGRAAFASGHVLFLREKTLFAQPLDTRSGNLSGSEISLVEGLMAEGDSGFTGNVAFSASPRGGLVYRLVGTTTSRLTWFDRSGRAAGTVGEIGVYAEPDLFPDGKRVAVAAEDPKSGKADIWVVELERGTFSRLTFKPGIDGAAVVSSDGTRVAYSSNGATHNDLFTKLASGAGEEELLLGSTQEKFTDCFTKDGRYVVFENVSPETRYDLWVLPLFGDRKAKPILQTAANEAHANVSPDSRWIAYASDESGRPEVYVQSFPSPSGKWQISTAGGDQPRWSADGKELFFVAADRKLMSVPVRIGEVFEPGAPRPLFALPVTTNGITDSRNQFVPAPDGQRFLVTALAEQGGSIPLTVVLDWPAELKK